MFVGEAESESESVLSLSWLILSVLSVNICAEVSGCVLLTVALKPAHLGASEMLCTMTSCFTGINNCLCCQVDM